MKSFFDDDLKRLKFEDFLWVVFGILCFINIYGDKLQEEYVYTRETYYQTKSNTVFTFTLIITFFIYIYFFLRNYHSYNKATEENKELFTIKLLGSSFLIAGIICLLYFQTNNETFVGTPSL